MKQHTLEERVAVLEKELCQLRLQMVQRGQSKDWQSTIGMFAGDEMMKRINEHARKYREADRKKARRRYAKKKRVKS